MTTTLDYTVRRKIYLDVGDVRLGRHVHWDSRSVDFFRAPEADFASLASRRHRSQIPTLDQLQLGSCTGNATTKCLSYVPFWPTLPGGMLSQSDALFDEEYAKQAYSDFTKADDIRGTWPPTDTGSDGLTAGKVMTARGLIAGYQHVTSLLALLTVLQDKPTITGSKWLGDMFNPDSDGRLHVTGSEEGGHEYVYDEIDVENRRVWIQNSWSDDWGIRGRAWLTWDDAESLLMDDGDATPFVPITQPAPSPTPTPDPDPTPVPDPTPAPVETFVEQASHWVGLSHTSKPNVLFEGQVQAYLDWLATQQS